MFFFVDKCLPFGASISCSHFQRFSNALTHIFEFITGQRKLVTNYLDDFLFVSDTERACNELVDSFLRLCGEINFPVAIDKTERASQRTVFLGILIDGENLWLAVPVEKKVRATNLLAEIIDNRKTTVKKIQVLAGYLNFLTKAIVPGRTFLRRMYAKYADLAKMGGRNVGELPVLKAHHHVKIDPEFKTDCRIWHSFLQSDNKQVCRPLIDLTLTLTADEKQFFSDAAKNPDLGFGCVFGREWSYIKWEDNFLQSCNPSIEFLELYALCMGVLIWQESLANIRVQVYCDNQAVVHMVNKGASTCKNCMTLLRILTLNNMTFNRRLFVQYINTKANTRSDALSRLDFKRFWRCSRGMEVSRVPAPLSPDIWPPSKIWNRDWWES